MPTLACRTCIFSVENCYNIATSACSEVVNYQLSYFVAISAVFLYYRNSTDISLQLLLQVRVAIFPVSVVAALNDSDPVCMIRLG